MFLSYTLPFILAAGAVWLGRKNWSDKDKSEKILELLEIKEGDKVRKFKLLRKDFILGDNELGMEYVYKIPLKTSMDQVEQIYSKLRDGINIKREGNQKHVEVSYDGVLKMRVYDKPIPKEVEYNRELVKMCKKYMFH
jgi:S-DNA-T family DNA segregation ATPase FtsK/SpoIIIE